MSAQDSERFIFEAEWYNKVASTLKKFYLHYFPSDNSVELFDLKTKKVFLRRSKCDGVGMKDFYIGATVSIFSRNMKITNFANSSTKDKLSSKLLRKCILLKSDIINNLGSVLQVISIYDFYISNIKMVNIDAEDAVKIFYTADNNQDNVIEHLKCGPVVVLELISKNNESKWNELLSVFEKKGFLTNIYVLKNEMRNKFFSVERNKTIKLKNTARLKNCTCCIIKPHAVQAGLTAPIINDIQKANFNISAIQRFHVDFIYAQEFLEVYKGILPDYAAMVSELSSGPCIAIEISSNNENINLVKEFRKFCGPMDPEIAKQIRSNTLRAKYGKSKVQNAVHCSDLTEDGILEVEYFFRILNDH